MASGRTDVGENRTLDAWFGGQALNPPATWYIGLHTVAAGEAGGGTEVAGNNYSRIAVTNNLTNFPAAVGGQKTNANPILSAISSGAWGTILSIAFYEAASGGSAVHYADIDAQYQQNINAANQRWEIPAGLLTLIDN